MLRVSSSRAAATRSGPAATDAWRRSLWAAAQRASCSTRSAARWDSARSTRPMAPTFSGGPAGELLDEIGSPLELGAINATHAVTVSGPSDAIDKLGAEARRRGVAFVD